MKMNQLYNIDWRSIDQHLQEFDELSEWLMENEMEFAAIKVRELIRDVNWGKRGENLEILRPFLRSVYNHLHDGFSLLWLIEEYDVWAMSVTKGRPIKYVNHVQYRITKHDGATQIVTTDFPRTVALISGEEHNLALEFRDVMCGALNLSKDKVLVRIW